MTAGFDPPSPWIVTRLCSLALLLATGCSVLAVRDARPTPTKAIVCESTWAPPILDALVAIGGVALIAWSTTDSNTGETDGHALTDREAAAYPGVLLALPFALSAAYGYVKVSTCKNAERAAATFAEK